MVSPQRQHLTWVNLTYPVLLRICCLTNNLADFGHRLEGDNSFQSEVCDVTMSLREARVTRVLHVTFLPTTDNNLPASTIPSP